MAGWTDYIPDWSSKDKIRLCSVYDALSALTAAVNERGSVLSSYTALSAVNRLYPVKYHVDLIDAKIKSIVPQFVNHTINGGDFSGLEAIPMWTWNSVLNEETEVNIDRLYPILDWVYQRYGMINNLRWTNAGSGDISQNFTLLRSLKEASDTITACNLAATTLEEEEWMPSLCFSHWHVGEALGGLYACEAIIARPVFSFSTNNPVLLSAKTDIYLHTVPTHSYTLFDGCGVFNEGWNRIQLNIEQTLPNQCVIAYGLPLTMPNMENPWYGFRADLSIGILKFTGSNGFQFKDW